MFTLRKCHFKASGDRVEFLVETKAKWGETHILVKSDSLCSDGPSLHKATFPQLSQSAVLEPRPPRQRREKRQGVRGAAVPSVTYH